MSNEENRHLDNGADSLQAAGSDGRNGPQGSPDDTIGPYGALSLQVELPSRRWLKQAARNRRSAPGKAESAE